MSSLPYHHDSVDGHDTKTPQVLEPEQANSYDPTDVEETAGPNLFRDQSRRSLAPSALTTGHKYTDIGDESGYESHRTLDDSQDAPLVQNAQGGTRYQDLGLLQPCIYKASKTSV
jgi:hypothetical protein